MSVQDDKALGVKIQDYPGGHPRWQKVDAAKLGHAPYNRICQVRGQSAAGSGWLTGAGKVVTAAHVVAGGQTADVRFADSQQWITASVEVTEGYLAPNGTQRRCSAQDLATLRLPAGSNVAIAPFAPVPGGLVSAIGFHDGELVQHGGTSLEVGPFTAHNCDTEAEHSGCPILKGSSLHAVHVGRFSGSAAYLSPPQSQTEGYLNSGVRVV